MLARYPDFRRLIGSNSVSLMGSSITAVALPLTAVTVLDASSAQMGLLGAAALAPQLVLGLPSGVLVDRLPYRRILVLTDLLQVVLIGCVPLLAVTGFLAIWQLYVVVLLTGVCTLFDAVATQSFTPYLVPRNALLRANSSLAISNSVVTTSGAAIAGVLVQALTAPIAIAVDAASFLVSAVWKTRLRTDRERPGDGHFPRSSQRLGAGIMAGLRVVWRQPIVRATTVAATIGAFAGQVQTVILILYLTRSLGVAPGWVGVVVAATGVAAVLGAVVALPITRRVGNGRAFIIGMLLTSIAGILLALAHGPMPAVIVVTITAQLLRGFGPSLFGINQQTLRQTLISADLLPRAQATWRFLVYGAQALGALLGGALGGSLGLRTTLIIGSIIMLIGVTTAIASPLRALKPETSELTNPDPL